MKFVTYKRAGEDRLGLYHKSRVYDLQDAGTQLGLVLPSTILEYLNSNEKFYPLALRINKEMLNDKIEYFFEEDQVKLLAPVPHPTSCRDGYAFRQHAESARRIRGLEMIQEFDQFPVFYFSNHNAVFGEGNIYVEDDHLQKLDFELEAAVVIGRKGKNIQAEEADSFIAGYMIMNDFSARKLQSDEMKLNLGPAKGKDFATAFGPWLVTTDELEEFKILSAAGARYSLKMKAYHNGKLISEGNLKDMNWTFAEIIERASYGAELLPGDVIGSGTVGTGCYLELNGTRALEAKARGEDFRPVWLLGGDTIELEITGLGRLKNKIVRTQHSYSILSKKK